MKWPNIVDVLTKLRMSMLEQNCGAYLIPCSDAHNTAYCAAVDQRCQFASGFNGWSGLAAIGMGAAAIWVSDFDYDQAMQDVENEWWDVYCENRPDYTSTDEWLKINAPIKCQIGVDPEYITAKAYSDLSQKLACHGLTLIPVTVNLVDELWDDKPSPPKGQIYPLPNEAAGLNWPMKVDRVREEMSAAGLGLVLLSNLDEIAWLLNLRGSDQEYAPTFFSYAALSHDTIFLFVTESRLTPEALRHLQIPSESEEKYTVHLDSYDSFFSFIQGLDSSKGEAGQKIAFDPATTNQAVACCVPQERRCERTSPVTSLLAVKNPVELSSIAEVHLHDSVAYCRLLHWLETTTSTEISELAILEQFEIYRKMSPAYKGPSFEPICASGPNSCHPLYSPTFKSSRLINIDDVIVIDTGGQYEYGSTDVTRTICRGTPTNQQRLNHTVVVQTHIHLVTSKFPKGTTGAQLDAICRAFMWNRGMDFSHLTGHGVGQFLSVVQAPIINSGSQSTKIEENMVVAIEPGYYDLKSSYGVRYENTYRIVADEHSTYGGFLTFKPLCFIPLQRKMIDHDVLTEKERQHINKYHEDCWIQISPFCSDHDVLSTWLKESTKPI